MNVTCDESMGGVESSFVMDYYPGMVPPMASVWIYKAYPKKRVPFRALGNGRCFSVHAEIISSLCYAPARRANINGWSLKKVWGKTNLTVKFNHGDEMGGESLEYLISIFEYFNETDITFIEIVSGELTATDYLISLNSYCGYSGHNNIAVIIDPSVDTSASFGSNPSIQFDANVLRFEAEGFTSLSCATLQANATDLPSLWVPNVTQLGEFGCSVCKFRCCCGLSSEFDYDR